jgi:hypothetical protein
MSFLDYVREYGTIAVAQALKAVDEEVADSRIKTGDQEYDPLTFQDSILYWN